LTHHTWKHRLKIALHNKNWKKVIIHEILELAWLGSWVTSMEGSWQGWAVGISGVVIIHFVVFETIDAMHYKKKK
jgi:hypothetical protein